MAVAVRRSYACPTCQESFTKWSLCQAHIHGSGVCRAALAELLEDVDLLQERCRAAAAPPSPPSPPHADPVGGAGADAARPPPPPAAPREPAPGLVSSACVAETVEAAPMGAPGLAGPPPKRVAVAVVKRLDRAVQTGHLTEAERILLDGKLEELAEYPFPVQTAALDKFLGPGLEDLRWVADKGSWLMRCLRFSDRTAFVAPPAPDAPPTAAGALIAALSAHALLPDALDTECWQMYAGLEPKLQSAVVEAVRCSIFTNVAGSLSDHFRNVLANEQVIHTCELNGVPGLSYWPDQLEWDVIEGTLYKRVLQHILFKQRNSEEHLLRDLAEPHTAPPGEPGSLLHLHWTTAQTRREGSADVLSILHAAASSGLVRVCARLIAEGLDVNERAGCQEVTPLHLAAIHGEVKTLRLLLARRADPNARDADGHTPLFAAVEAAAQLKDAKEEALTYHDLQMQTARLLLEAGAENEPEGVEGQALASPESLAEECGLADLRNLIRLHCRLRALHRRCQIDEQVMSEVCGLQCETAMFFLTLFDRHVIVSPEAAPTEFRAILQSEYVRERDHVRRLGNRLARRLKLSRRALDSLNDLPPQAGIAALKTWKIQETVPHLYEVPDALNEPEPEAAPSGEALARAGEDGSEAQVQSAPAQSAQGNRFQGRVRKWDSERGFGFIVQDLQEGEDVGKDIFVHRKNVVGSSPLRHLDLKEGCRISYRLGEQDGRPRALEATMLDPDGKVAAVHLLTGRETNLDRPQGGEEGGETGGAEGDLSWKFLKHLRSREILEIAKDKRGKIDSWLRCVGLRRHNVGRRDDALWKREIERRVDIFLERRTTPLQKRDFDFRVRRFLHEFSVQSSVTRVSEALAMVESSTAGKSRDGVRNWPAYVATLLRNFNPGLHEILAERDRRSRLDGRRARAEAYQANANPKEAADEYGEEYAYYSDEDSEGTVGGEDGGSSEVDATSSSPQASRAAEGRQGLGPFGGRPPSPPGHRPPPEPESISQQPAFAGAGLAGDPASAEGAGWTGGLLAGPGEGVAAPATVPSAAPAPRRTFQ